MGKHVNVPGIVAEVMLVLLGIDKNDDALIDTNTPADPKSWMNHCPGAMTVYWYLDYPLTIKQPFIPEDPTKPSLVVITYTAWVSNSVEAAIAKAQMLIQEILK